MSQPDEWYVSREGQRFGPVTFRQLVEAAKAGRLEPRTDLVIGAGMADWLAAGDVDGIFEKKVVAEPVAKGAYQAPKDSMADSGSYDARPQQKLHLPGAPRLGYFLGITVLPGVVLVGLIKAIPELSGMVGEKVSPYVPALLLIVPLIAIVVTVKRFQNLAMSGWWWFGTLVPILNLWLCYRLFACPPGYAYTGKLDAIGKFLAVIYWLVPVLLIGLAIMVAPQLKEMERTGQLERNLNQMEKVVRDFAKPR